jgi:hypothetical protein
MLNYLFNRRSKQLAVAFTGMVAAGLFFAPDAHADRRSSLNGNVLIEDQDDSFVFPQLLDDYGGRFTFDYGANAQSGSGLVVWDFDSVALGIGLNRGTLPAPELSPNNEINALGFPSLPLLSLDVTGQNPATYLQDPAGAGVNTFTAIDLLLSLGDLGFRLGLGSGRDISTADGDTGYNHTFFNLGAGLGFDAGDAHFDTALNFLVDGGSTLQGGDTVLDGTVIRLAVDARGYFPVTDVLDFGTLAEIDFQSQTVTQPQVPDDPSSQAIRFRPAVGAGPIWNLARDTTLAAYAVAGFDVMAVEPNTEGDDDQSSSTNVLLPGVRAAFETAILDWLYLRTGMRYDFNVIAASFQEAVGDRDDSDIGGSFDWDAGIGLDFDYLRIDGTFNPAFLTNGPNFVSGATTAPMFGIVSATLDMDALSEIEEFDVEPTEEEETRMQGTPPGQTQQQPPARQPQAQQPPARQPQAQQPQAQQPQAQQPQAQQPQAQQPQAQQPPAQPVVEPFDEQGRQSINDGTARGTVAQDWAVWYDGAPWGEGHTLRTKNGEQTIAVEMGSYGIKRSFGNVGGRTAKVQHRFSGNGYYEVMAGDETLVRYTEPTYQVDELKLPAGTDEIRFKVGSVDEGTRATATIMNLEIQ